MFPFNIAGGKGGVDLSSSATSGDVYGGDARTGASTSGASGIIPSPASGATIVFAIGAVVLAMQFFKRK